MEAVDQPVGGQPRDPERLRDERVDQHQADGDRSHGEQPPPAGFAARPRRARRDHAEKREHQQHRLREDSPPEDGERAILPGER